MKEARCKKWLERLTQLEIFLSPRQNIAWLYRVPQDERSIFWEVIVSVILRKKTLYEHVYYSKRFLRYSLLNVNHKTADSHASDSGAAGQEGRILGAQAKPLHSQMALPRKPFGIGHMFI
jgi:hypothetical protein